MRGTRVARRRIVITATLAALACVFGTFQLASARATHPPDLTGSWHGKLVLPQGELRIVFHLSRKDSGYTATLDSPDQDATGIPVSAVTVKGDTIRLDVDAAGGVYDGVVQQGGQKIAGKWSQGGSSLPLELTRSAEAPAPQRRPQEPTGALPYSEEEVRYDNPAAAGVRLAGTLTLPRTPGRHAAALLITGSGPQNRNEELLGHKPFLVLADYLTRRGIAVLRVDDRGVAASTGDFAKATSLDFASDAKAGIAYLKSRPEINPAAIGLIGHSEGGLIAPIVATESNDVAWIVMMAGPGIPGDSILYLQGELIARASGSSEAAIRQSRDVQRKAFAALREAATDSVASARVREVLTAAFAAMGEADRKTMGLPPGGDSQIIEQQTRMFVSPWFRFFLSHDPYPTIARVKVPVLAINGSLDLQVPAEANLSAIRRALETGGNRRHAVRELPGLNHLFQTAKTGGPAEYAQIEETMSPAALQLVSAWITETVQRR
ncbi:MAG: CocE/NonD family hydrolase [Gemmatimonadaceae bacterium]